MDMNYRVTLESDIKTVIQLQAVNDKMHERFYGKLEYKDCTNLKIKAKWL